MTTEFTYLYLPIEFCNQGLTLIPALALYTPELISALIGLSQQAEPPKYSQPPDGLVENPHRKGSWGKYENGKFEEKWRFDKGDPKKPGWGGKDHLHFDGEKEHYPPDTPYPENGD